MRSRSLIASGLIAFAIVALSPLALAGAPVTTARLRASFAAPGFRVLAEVQSLGATTLAAPITGRILGPFVTTRSVTKGAVIARNAPANLSSSMAAAQAQLAFAQTQYARAAKLVADKAAAQATLDAAQRDLANARQALNALVVESRQQELKSPVSGLIHYFVAPGAVVYKGNPVAAVSGRGSPWISALVPPGQAAQLTLGRHAAVSLAAPIGDGVIVAIGSDARRDGLVEVRIAPPKASRLLPGQWVHVRFPGKARPGFETPAASLVSRGASTFVYVIRHGKAHATLVTVLAQKGASAWIAGKLAAGERVALVGSSRLVDGASVAEAR